MSECMIFPKTADEFINQFKFTDTKQIYSNGAELMSVFRVNQMMEHYFATDNHVGSKWIPVTERLPQPGERVLATDGGFVGEFYINKRGQWQRYNVNDSSLLMALDILWWMPLPQPPKGECV